MSDLHPLRIISAVSIAAGVLLFSIPPDSLAQGRGQGDERRADPCEEPPQGKAVGWEHHCPPLGVSNGVASGNFNGDDAVDLAIGVPFDDVVVAGARYTGAGAVNVVYGSSAFGLTPAGNQYWHQGQTPQGSIQGGLQAHDNFGMAVAAVNFNGDGYDDLVIGVPFETVGGVVHAGAIHILFGSPTGLTASGNVFIHQNTSGLEDASEAHDHFGEVLTWGRFNADQFGDIAVGIPDEDVVTTTGALITDAGAVQIVFGPFAFNQFLSQDPPEIGTAAEAFDGFGQALTAGNFNGDNFDDLVIGVPAEDLTFDGVLYENAGIATVLHGGPQFFLNVSPPLPNQTHHQRFLFPGGGGQDGRLALNTGDTFGAALAAGDFNRDGYAPVSWNRLREMKSDSRHAPLRGKRV